MERFVCMSRAGAEEASLEECLRGVRLSGACVGVSQPCVGVFLAHLHAHMSRGRLVEAAMAPLRDAAECGDLRRAVAPLLGAVGEAFATRGSAAALATLEALSRHAPPLDFEPPHLAALLAALAAVSPDGDRLALATLANLCRGAPAKAAFLRAVDARSFVANLIADPAADVHTSRFLYGMRDAPSQSDVHNYLHVALGFFQASIRGPSPRPLDLHYVDAFLNDLCSDPLSRRYVSTYEPLENVVRHSLKLVSESLSIIGEDAQRLCIVLRTFTRLMAIECYDLRRVHGDVANLCVKCTSIPDAGSSAFALLSTVLSQYEDDGMLPDELMPTVSMGLSGLLDPADSEAGLDWMRFVYSLCGCISTREAVLVNVKVDKLLNVFKRTLDFYEKKGNSREPSQELVLLGCDICLCLLERSDAWLGCLHNILSHPSGSKIFNSFMRSVSDSQRRRFLKVIRHPDFPIDKLNTTPPTGIDEIDIESGLNNRNFDPIYSHIAIDVGVSREKTIDDLLVKISGDQDANNTFNSTNLIELLKYKIYSFELKIMRLEQTIQAANSNNASLMSAAAIADAISKNQEELLFQTHARNTKLEEICSCNSKQIADAEKIIKKFQGKLAAARLDREQQISSIHREHSNQVKEMEDKMNIDKNTLHLLQEKVQTLETNRNSLIEKLEDQVKKNGELASVLLKFEDKVKEKDRKLEEARGAHVHIKDELESSKQTIKNLEKTLLERNKRLEQVTAQLEEMNRIQNMIANLMGSKSSSNDSNGNM